jgi:hypothetical protein
MTRSLTTIVFLALLALPSARAEAAPITFIGSSGSLAASVTFEDSGGNLIVTLTNTSTADVLVPTDILTAVFFESTDTSLTPASAVLNAGSTVIYDPDGQPVGGVVGGEWAEKNTTVFGGTNGISSTGLGIFGPSNRFPGPDLQSPASPDGMQYGIVSAGDNPATGNGGVMGSGGLIKNSVVFTLSGWTGGDAATAIKDVTFFYGTSLGEGPNFPGVPGGPGPSEVIPEPTTLTLFGTGLALSALRARRNRKAKAPPSV